MLLAVTCHAMVTHLTTMMTNIVVDKRIYHAKLLTAIYILNSEESLQIHSESRVPHLITGIIFARLFKVLLLVKSYSYLFHQCIFCVKEFMVKFLLNDILLC